MGINMNDQVSAYFLPAAALTIIVILLLKVIFTPHIEKPCEEYRNWTEKEIPVRCIKYFQEK